MWAHLVAIQKRSSRDLTIGFKLFQVLLLAWFHWLAEVCGQFCCHNYDSRNGFVMPIAAPVVLEHRRQGEFFRSWLARYHLDRRALVPILFICCVMCISTCVGGVIQLKAITSCRTQVGPVENCKRCPSSCHPRTGVHPLVGLGLWREPVPCSCKRRWDSLGF